MSEDYGDSGSESAGSTGESSDVQEEQAPTPTEATDAASSEGDDDTGADGGGEAPPADEGEPGPLADEDEAAPPADEGEPGPLVDEDEAAPPADEGEPGAGEPASSEPGEPQADEPADDPLAPGEVAAPESASQDGEDDAAPAPTLPVDGPDAGMNEGPHPLDVGGTGAGQQADDSPAIMVPSAGDYGSRPTNGSADRTDADDAAPPPEQATDGQDAHRPEPSEPTDEAEAKRGWQEGDPIPPPLEGEKLPTKDLEPPFRGEDDPNNENRRFYPQTVDYWPGDQRESSRLFVDGDGLLRKTDGGELFDTSGANTLHSGDGRAIFVMDGSGNMYATPDHKIGKVHHSSLLAGGPVAGAGEINVRDGELGAMTDQSGHYQPSAEMNDRALGALRDQGLQTAPDFKQYDWRGRER